MTRAKYKRLLLVLLGPLLLAGGIAAFLVNLENGRLHLRCDPFFGYEHCRSTGFGALDERVAKDYPAWFDVNTRPYDHNKFPEVYVSASQRLVPNVTIQKVSPYSGTADTPGSPLDQLRSLSGQKINIIFGDKNDSYRTFNPLGCNQLDFEEGSPNTFAAGLCGIPNGVAHVTFTVRPSGQKQLLALKSEIDGTTKTYRQAMIMNYVILTPIFVVLFLIISGLVWIVSRAFSYVAAA